MCSKMSPSSSFSAPNIQWYWVDFHNPSEEEALQSEELFPLSPSLAIEDCFFLLQRPKMDHYENVDFFVMHAINAMTLGC